jgi:hypothetical protein
MARKGNKWSIKETAKSTRLFAPFQNVEHQREMFDSLLDRIPVKYRFDVILYIGQMESTFAEGYYENINKGE